MSISNSITFNEADVPAMAIASGRSVREARMAVRIWVTEQSMSWRDIAKRFTSTGKLIATDDQHVGRVIAEWAGC
jgi:hypothetical protein